MIKYTSFLLILILVSCGEEAESPEIAMADIFEVFSEDQVNFTTGDQIGTAAFYYNKSSTLVEVNLSGLEPNTSHAMHLHLGSLEAPGMHWNRGSSDSFCNRNNMGEEWDKPKAGDIGNIDIDENGEGFFKLRTSLWSLYTEDNSDIIGTVLFVHETPEQFSGHCQFVRVDGPNHSNDKIAGGTVVAQN